jgi:monovalent cation:H+ antiporter-2, CPA2 family
MLLSQVEKTGSRELFTLAVVALALGVAFGSAKLFGVSFALGAFFAGVVVNESDLSHRAAKELQPLQDAFTVLFFVAVGMLFDPSILVRQPLRVLAVLVIVVIGKSLAAFGIVRALGGSTRTALIVSAALAQIGEFSFILSGLGGRFKSCRRRRAAFDHFQSGGVQCRDRLCWSRKQVLAETGQGRLAR